MNFHPKPAPLVQVDKIPAELKAIPQWVVWRPINRQMADGTTKVTKPPYRSSDPAREASVTDPSTWSTFEDAWQCYQIYAAQGVAGIGFTFTKGCGFFGIDLDTEKKLLQQHLERRRRTFQFLSTNIVTYTETSPSGDGLHFICRGNPSFSAWKDDSIGIEVYGWDRFFTVTGNVWEGRETITDQQGLADSITGRGSDAPLDIGDLPEHRKMDLSDHEVVRLASNGNPSFAPRFNGTGGCEPGEWSDSFMAVIAGLDRITGSAEQIERIVKNSPMVLHVGPAGNNETRVAKANRLFAKVLTYVREGNTSLLTFAEHGRQIWEGMERAKEKRLAEALRLAKDSEGKLSKGAVSVLEAFPQIGPEYRVLSRPPGITGEFVAATEEASYLPFTKYAVPATLAVLSGIIGRQYKVDGSGLNLNFILLAPTAAGKTNTMSAWLNFVGQVNNTLPATPSGPPKNRIVKNSTSSIQGIMPYFIKTPSCVWFVEEAGSLLKLMNETKHNQQGATLRDKFNELYDSSQEHNAFNAPASSENRKVGIEPIFNLNVSTFWTTVPTKFDPTNQDAFDGFMSRIVLVRHKGKSGDLKDAPIKALPLHLRDRLRDLLASATDFDEKYAIPTARAFRNVEIPPEVRSIYNTFRHIAQSITSDAQDEKIPGIYTAISRLPPIALRIAGTLAALDSPYAPVITELQLKWSFGYLLHNLVGLLSDMDKGEIGDKANEEFTVVIKRIKHLTTKPKYKDMGGVPMTPLKDDLKQRQPFKSNPPGAYKMVNDVLDSMVKDNLIATKQWQNPKARRETLLYCLTPEGLDQ